MKTWSFYDPSTGMFVGRTFSGPDDSLEHHLPIDLDAAEGEYDHLAYRVDLKSGLVVEWVPPQPNEDSSWNALARRWLRTEAATARELRLADVRAEITALEAKQPRALREAALGREGAKERLQELDDQIAALRPRLSG